MADDATHLSASQSQLSSSSSVSSLSPSKLCSRTYKKASQLYLTRRLHESLTALEPVITPSQVPDDLYVNGDASTSPIAAAPSTWRIKVWNLYITLLSAIVDLGPEEGRKLFGQKEWKAVSSQVRDGGIWETVVQTGYRGLEGSVDAEVVYNLCVLEDLSLGRLLDADRDLQGYAVTEPLSLASAQSTASRNLSVVVRSAGSGCRRTSAQWLRESHNPT